MFILWNDFYLRPEICGLTKCMLMRSLEKMSLLICFFNFPGYSVWLKRENSHGVGGGTFLFVLMRLQSGQMDFWLSDPFQISRPLVCVSYVLKNISDKSLARSLTFPKPVQQFFSSVINIIFLKHKGESWISWRLKYSDIFSFSSAVFMTRASG